MNNNTKHILVIDDEEGICRGIRRVLEPTGCQVAASHDGKEGLDFVKNNPLDLVLIDVKIPGISGLDLIKLIHEVDPEIICIIITGYATVEMAVSAIKEGAYDFLTKPFTTDTLLLAVNQGLERRRLSMEVKKVALAEAKARRLADEKARLEDLNQAKAQFIRLVTHELQTPVSAVENYLKLILGGYVPDEKEEEILRKCIVRTEEERMLIADLLELGHLDVLDSFQLDQVSLYQKLVKTLNDCMEAADEKELEITLDADHDIPNIMTAPEKIRSLWCNLIGNAIKYTPRNGRISISLSHKDGDIQGEVSDTGIGIPAGEQERLFSEFFRASNAREEGISGTGLGLAIVKRIVEGLGGRITVKSKLGKGTTFKFWIPVLDGPL
jgi:two-component system sensor histidine kinase/response regulator